MDKFHSRTGSDLSKLTSEVRIELLLAVDERLTAESRLAHIAELKTRLQLLSAIGYRATSFCELVHVYRHDLVEKEIWRQNKLVGLTACTVNELRAAIYNRLWEAATTALSSKRNKLARYYTDGLLALKQLWKVKQFVRVVNAIGQLQEVLLQCDEQ